MLLLIIVVIVLLWKAFGPGSRARYRAMPQPQIKGPDDDDEFLWTIKKQRFKERRAAEQAAREEEERMRRARDRYTGHPDDPTDNGDTGKTDTPEK
nr:hypothetical protein [Corynebacterium pygosceleis]